jgi:predicted DNA-binding transcriptional regulator YafY
MIIENETFTKHSSTTNENIFRYSVGIFISDSDAAWVSLKCKNHLLPILKAHKIHPSQNINLDSQEFIMVKFQAHITEELKRKLLQFGSDIEVSFPQSLAKMLVKEAEKIKKLYTNL